ITAETQAEIDQIQQQLTELEASLPVAEIEALEQEIATNEKQRGQLELPTALAKGEISPMEQRLERAIVAHGEDSAQARQLRTKLQKLRRDYEKKVGELAEIDAVITESRQRLNTYREQLTNLDRQMTALTRQKRGLEEKLTKLDPQGVAQIGKLVRDAPLLDWFNPTEKPQQVVVPDVRTDLNFLTVETIDRCQTCHFNISDPAYEQTNLLMFAERQVASMTGQDVSSVDQPVVLIDFWETAIERVGQPLAPALEQARTTALERINEVRGEAGLEPLAGIEQLHDEFDAIIARKSNGDDGPALQDWYNPLTWYLADLKALLLAHLGEDGFAELEDNYRFALVDRYNDLRAEDGLSALSANQVQLGHPKIDLYASPESVHPMKTMGCTVCHEGSGQETDFVHSAHTPRDVWVDARTGAEVPKFLIREYGDKKKLKLKIHEQKAPAEVKQPEVARAGSVPDLSAFFASASTDTSHDDPAHGGSARWSQHDVNLANPDHPAPYAPEHPPHGNAALYVDLTNDQPRIAVRQADYWAKTYGWHKVHYMEWEKPMHALEYVQSACNRCHTETFDIRDAAPKLYEGRKLFTQLGCASCHNVTDLQDDPDLHKVGPSLIHVKDKLSPKMAASWIWSPKAFRPTTEMPHFFMLESNSAPIDILRTRTEVAAMTWYLMNQAPNAAYYEEQNREVPSFEVQTPPEEAGSIARGREVFNEVGCLACHSNLDEHGETWIVEDLKLRYDLDDEGAQGRYDEMAYNERHWYAQQHLEDKLSDAGPELSGVGTKLLAGRTEEEARAWVYSWVRQPSHYSEGTIMPDFRLSETEANDLAAYLLSLKRPGYEAHAFYTGDGDQIELTDPRGMEMLNTLVTELNAGPIPRSSAADQTAAMPTTEKLALLGDKMIQHYNCNSCHLINGFEDRAPAAPNLDGWGVKDP
ncbi:MAG: c-type cytochrome, partial [Phycisphaeraceae bacterium]|nr:c-type cytochrome [Phycisphaeraceae bacterium]